MEAKTKSGTFLTESCGGAMCTPRMMERILQHYKMQIWAQCWLPKISPNLAITSGILLQIGERFVNAILSTPIFLPKILNFGT